MIKNIIIAILQVVVAALLFVLITYKEANKIGDYRLESQTIDTVSVVTAEKEVVITDIKPTHVVRNRKVTVKDTVFISTLVTKDSLIVVEVPIYDYVFSGEKDSVKYSAKISGNNVTLDSLEFYYPFHTITTQKTETKRKRFNYGIGGGFGYGLTTGKVDIFVGVTATYTF